MHRVSRDTNFAWYWKGKPLRKGKFHGEHLRPVYVGTNDGDTCSSVRGASPCSSRQSLFSERSTCNYCEMNQVETRPTTPTSTEHLDCVPSKKCCGRSYAPRPEPAPSHPVHVCRCGLRWQFASRPMVETSCSHRSIESRLPNISRAKQVPGYCRYPKLKTHNRSQDSFDSSFYTPSCFGDNSASETSVEVSPDSEWDVNEPRCDFYHRCHPPWDCRGAVCGKM